MINHSRLFRPCVLGLVAAAGGAFASPALADFTYSDFSSTSGLTLNGAAIPFENAISVTPPTARSAGSFFHNDRQNITLGFTSNFQFRVRHKSGLGSDGFAFVIQNCYTAGNEIGGAVEYAGASAMGVGGGAMGYASNLQYPELGVGINNSVAFEFDMWNNPEWNDWNSDNHISVHAMGPMANRPDASSSVAHMSPASDMSDGSIYDVRLIYTPGLMNLYMKKATDASFGAALLSFNVNLSDLMTFEEGPGGASQAYVGFTAGTGGAANVQRHEILSWDFSGNTVPAPGAGAMIALSGALAARRRRRA